MPVPVAKIQVHTGTGTGNYILILIQKNGANKHCNTVVDLQSALDLLYERRLH